MMPYFEVDRVHPEAERFLPPAVARLRMFAPRYYAGVVAVCGKRLTPDDMHRDPISVWKVTENLPVFELLSDQVCAKILSQVDNTTGLTGSNQNHSVTFADAGAEWGLSLYAKVLSEKKWLSLDSLGFSLVQDGNVLLPVGACMLARIVASLEKDLRDRGVLVVSIENIITDAGACAARKAGFRVWENGERQWADYIIIQ